MKSAQENEITRLQDVPFQTSHYQLSVGCKEVVALKLALHEQTKGLDSDQI